MRCAYCVLCENPKSEIRNKFKSPKLQVQNILQQLVVTTVMTNLLQNQAKKQEEIWQGKPRPTKKIKPQTPNSKIELPNPPSLLAMADPCQLLAGAGRLTKPSDVIRFENEKSNCPHWL
jgi:hypothetical protein